MTTGFGFCPNCGTPRVAAEQRFCAGCGATLSSAAPSVPVAASEPIAPPAPAESAAAAQLVAPPPAPPAWSVPPAPPAAAQPVAPPAWSVASPGAATPAGATGPSYHAPPGAPGAPVPAAPSAPAKPLVTIGGVNVTPKMAAIGGIALAAILVVVYFVSSSSKSSGITVTPATFSCSSTSAMVTVVMRLPSTVQATDALVFQQDGVNIDTIGITIHTSDLFARQADGSWAYTRTDTAKSNCSGSSSTQLSMGTHTMAILDTAGHVLAQGSFTLTP